MDFKFKKKGSILWEVLLFGLTLIFIVSLSNENTVNDRKATDVSAAYSKAAVLGARISEYRLQVGEYPESLNDLTKAVGQYGAWIKVVEKDPWGRDYVYLHDGKDGYAIFSLGKDGVNTGSDINAIQKGNIGYVGR
jgi:Bacterial type II secretion system protein G.